MLSLTSTLRHLGAKKIVLILYLYILYPRKVVYNTMQEITLTNKNLHLPVIAAIGILYKEFIHSFGLYFFH